MASLVLQLLVYKKIDTLTPLFLSLNNQSDKSWRLLVLQNGPDEALAAEQNAAIQKAQPDFPVEVFFSEKNLGFAGGQEFLFQKHQADYVFLVNDDAILDPDYVARLRQFLDSHEQVGAVSGAILRWNFSDSGEVVKTSIVDSLGLNKNRTHKVYDVSAGKIFNPSAEACPVFGVSGCLPMYRRVAVGEQMFDPTYVSYKEDIDLAYRLNRSGWSSFVLPEAVAYHQRSFRPGQSRRQVPDELQFLSYRNHWRNLLKHLTWRDWLKDGWAIVPFEIAKFFYFLFTKPSTLWKFRHKI